MCVSKGVKSGEIIVHGGDPDWTMFGGDYE